MKFYHRKLSGLEALKMEQARLQNERKHASFPGLDFAGSLKGDSASASSGSDILGSVLELAFAGKDAQFIIAAAKPLLKLLRRKLQKKSDGTDEENVKAGRSLLGRFLREVAVGYLTGKVAMWSFRGAKALVRRRRRTARREDD